MLGRDVRLPVLGMLRLVPHRPLVTCGSCLLVTLSPANFLVSSGRRELDCAVTAIVECWRFGSCVNAWFGIQSSWYRGTFRFFIGLALQRLANREVPGNLDKRRVLVRLPEAACLYHGAKRLDTQKYAIEPAQETWFQLT